MMSQIVSDGKLSSPTPELEIPMNKEGTRAENDILTNHKSTGPKKVRFDIQDQSCQSPVGASSPEEDVEISLSSWNSHNQNLFNLREELLGLTSQIWIIQEGNINIKDGWQALGYRWHCKTRNDKQLMIGTIPSIKTKRRRDLETQNSLIIEAHIGNSQILIGDIHQTEDRSEYRIILESFRNQLSIVGSDLNTKPRRPMTNFSIISDSITRKSKNQNRNKWKNNFLNLGSQIDFIFIHKGIRFHQNQTDFITQNNTLISDHKPLKTTLLIRKDDTMKYPVIDTAGVRDKYCVWEQKERKWKLREEYRHMSVKELLRDTTQLKAEDRFVNFKAPKHVAWDEEFCARVQEMERNKKKQFHKLIQHTTQIKREKEGGIINIMKEGELYITDYKEITHRCIRKLTEIQGILTEEEYEKRPWRNTTELNIDHIRVKEGDNTDENLDIEYFLRREDEYIQWYNKALSYDFIHLTVLRLIMQEQNRKGVIDLDFFRLESWNQMNQYVFSQRLVPLNKVAPNIASVEEMRPILIQSHLIKAVEWCFMTTLRCYLMQYIKSAQVGFVEGLGTQVQIGQLLLALKIKGGKKNIAFFDLSNAYNSVNREILYEMILHSNMFLPEQVDFLFNLYDSMYIYDPIEKKKIRFKNGLIQGSALSPYLFNIYFERLLTIFQAKIDGIINKLDKRQTKKKRLLKDIQILAYADDLAIISHQDIIALVCETFIEATREGGLMVNLKKSKYIANRHNVPLDHVGLEKVEYFRYLGVHMNIRGNIKEQFRISRQSVIQKSKQLSRIRKILPFRVLTKLWILYILPLIRYNNLAIWFQKKSQIKLWQTLKRNSFRRVMGLANNFPKQQLDELIGLLEFDISKDQYIDRQIKLDLFREYVIRELNSGDTDGRSLRNCFEFYLFTMEIRKKEGNEQRYEEVMIRGGTDAQNFAMCQPEFGEAIESYEKAREDKFEQKRKELDRAEQEKLIKLGFEEKVNLLRRTNFQKIRRVPGYEYFELWKHGWRKCKSHGERLNFEHIKEHLGRFNQDWAERVNRIVEYVGDITKRFYPRVQKCIQTEMKATAKRIREIIKQECEPSSKDQPIKTQQI